MLLSATRPRICGAFFPPRRSRRPGMFSESLVAVAADGGRRLVPAAMTTNFWGKFSQPRRSQRPDLSDRWSSQRPGGRRVVRHKTTDLRRVLSATETMETWNVFGISCRRGSRRRPSACSGRNDHELLGEVLSATEITEADLSDRWSSQRPGGRRVVRHKPADLRCVLSATEITETWNVFGISCRRGSRRRPSAFFGHNVPMSS